MKIKILIGELPPSDNHAYLQRGKMRFLSAQAKKFKESIAEIAKKSMKKMKMVLKPTPLHIKISYYLKRDRDLLGSDKVMIDALQGIVFENDSQIEQAELYKYKDKDNPRIEIVINDYERDNSCNKKH